jgi:hypothetical protein
MRTEANKYFALATLLIFLLVPAAESQIITNVDGVYSTSAGYPPAHDTQWYALNDSVTPFNHAVRCVALPSDTESVLNFTVTPTAASLHLLGEWYKDWGDAAEVRVDGLNSPLGMKFFVPGQSGSTRNFSYRFIFQLSGNNGVELGIHYVQLVDMTGGQSIHLTPQGGDGVVLGTSLGYGQVSGSGVGSLIAGHSYWLRASFSGQLVESNAFMEFKLGINSPIVYGTSYPGTNGIHPKLVAEGASITGLPMTLKIDQALGGAQAYIFIGASEANTPLPNGGALLVGSPVIVPVTLSGSGTLEIPFDLPDNTPVGSVYLQALVVDPGVPSGYSVTQGVRLDISE